VKSKHGFVQLRLLFPLAYVLAIGGNVTIIDVAVVTRPDLQITMLLPNRGNQHLIPIQSMTHYVAWEPVNRLNPDRGQTG
jgi:hypothetical protein